MSRSDVTRGLLLGTLGVVIFAMTTPMTRLAVGDVSAPQLPPAFVTAGRAAVAGVLSALYLLGWGASLGGLVGAVVGAEGGKGDLPTLIKDALEAGHVVMVVHANTDDEADRARHIVGGFDDSGADRTPVPARQAFVTAAS